MSSRRYEATGYPERSRARVISSHRIEHRDPYQPGYYTAVVLTVLSPTWSNPYPTLSVTVANQGGSCRFRAHDLASLRNLLVLSPDTEDKISAGLALAQAEADRIAEDMRLVLQRRNMPRATQIVRGDTGEILARGADRAEGV